MWCMTNCSKHFMMVGVSAEDVYGDICELLCTGLKHTTRNVVRTCSLASVDPGEGSPHAGWRQGQHLVNWRGWCLLCRGVVFSFKPSKEVI